MKKRFNKRGTLAISQILILIVGIVAVSYAIGSEVGEIGGQVAPYKEDKPFDSERAQYYGFGGEIAIDFDNNVWVKNNYGSWVSMKDSGITAENIQKNYRLTSDLAERTASASTAKQSATLIATPQKDDINTAIQKSAETIHVSNYELSINEMKESLKATKEELTKIKVEEGVSAQAKEDIDTAMKKAVDAESAINEAEKKVEDYEAEKKIGAGEVVGAMTVAKRATDNAMNDAKLAAQKAGQQTSVNSIQTQQEQLKVSWDKVESAAASRVITDAQGFNLMETPIKGLKIDGESFGDIVGIKEMTGEKFSVMTDQGKTATLTTEQLKDKGILDSSGKIIQSKLKMTSAETGSDIGNFLANKWKWDVGASNAVGHILEGLGWASTAVGVIQLTRLFGVEESLTTPLSQSAFFGILAGKSLYGLIKEGGLFEGVGNALPGGAGVWSVGVGAGIATWIFLSEYKDQDQKTVIFSCYPWEAPVGGNYCEQCNKQGTLSCSEYQCRSLGQGCQLLNAGTDEEACTWVNRKDVAYPTIESWKEALQEGFEYQPDKTISPPDRGVKVVNKKSTLGCAKAFSPISFGVTTNEPAKCKLDVARKKNFDDMSFYFSNGLFKYNHSFAISLPGSNGLDAEGITLKNDGNYEIHVRCQDANGNSNTATFVFKYCVEKGPDTTPPLIVGTNLLNNMPIAYEQQSITMEVYVNEPAECRWTHDKDKGYEQMEGEMSCNPKVREINAQMLYPCFTTLDGLKDRQENKFYFRCKDQPSKPDKDRFTMQEGYEFTLIGTQPLVISSASPNNTIIKDSTSPVKITLEAETSAGYKEGEAYCYYSKSCYITDESKEDYILFGYKTGEMSYQHTQDLWLTKGAYDCSIKCIDLGGNADTEEISFSVDIDDKAPVVVRAYHEDTYLKLITNEKAECRYDIKSCNYLFDDGVKMSNIKNKEHYTNWKTDTSFYIKCSDEYGKMPLPDKCSIVVRPSEF